MKQIVTFLCLGLYLICGRHLSGQTIDTLVRVGEHHLHFHIIKGEGTPILFEAGNGDAGEVWESLLEAIKAKTGATLITYDRAGLGGSEIDTATISFAREVEQLEAALKGLGNEGELFVVNHSYGAFYTTLLAHRGKFDIKGMVFVDPALPCYFTPTWSKSYRKGLSEEDWAMLKEHRAGLYYVLQDLDGIAEYMLDKSLPAEIRATLIAAEEIHPMVKAKEVQIWKDCMRSFGQARKHRYVLAKGAGHKVWNKNPEIVVKEIARLYRKLHRNKR